MDQDKMWPAQTVVLLPKKKAVNIASKASPTTQGVLVSDEDDDGIQVCHFFVSFCHHFCEI
jgi:hypothetical protein